ncbi:hypothetical protein F4678DRAFT_62997 [Xylaria arbuscula]|nr:hypothetical protein F4678DRAFT_62997 [Xylaria arbuscula]
MGPPSSPQPNFTAMSDHCHTMAVSQTFLAQQFKLFPNLATDDNTQLLSTEIERVKVKLDKLETNVDDHKANADDRFEMILKRIDARMDTFEKHMDARMDARMAAGDNNSIVRIQNARITRSTDKLYPLYATSTNMPIQNFPSTTAEIDMLSGATLNEFFSLLGHSPPSNLHHKRQQLKRLAGVINRELTD